MSLYFTDKGETIKRRKNGEDPTRILVTFERPDNKYYPKLNSNIPWTDEQTEVYGDLIVVEIAVLGKD